MCRTINIGLCDDMMANGIGGRLKEYGCDYYVMQFEKGHVSEHAHLQGYVHFPHAVRWSQFKNAFAPYGPHFEKAKGTARQNRQYCTKEDTRLKGPYEFGECPGGQGKSAELQLVN